MSEGRRPVAQWSERAFEQTRAVGARTFSSLRHRDFRLFYAGQLISLIGTWMQSTAQGWLVLELTDSELLLGLVSAAGSLPILMFTLWAGVLADRADKRRIILVAQSLSLVFALSLAILTHTGTISIGLIILLAFMMGISNAFEVPTRQSFFAELVGKSDLTNAIALNSSAFNLTRVIGPALAGMLIGVAGVAVCFYVNALSYVAVIMGLSRIRGSGPPAEAPRQGVGENLREGFRFIIRNRLASTLVSLVAIASIFAFPYAVMLPVFARDVLGVGAAGLGLLLSATGAGALVGGITVAAIAGRVARGPLLLGSATAFGLLIAGFSQSRWLPLSVALLVGVGFSVIPFTATVNGILQSIVLDELRGRVMGVYVFMFLGMTPFGSLQAGMLATWLGAPAALGLSASVFLLTLAAAWVNLPELRNLR